MVVVGERARRLQLRRGALVRTAGDGVETCASEVVERDGGACVCEVEAWVEEAVEMADGGGRRGAQSTKLMCCVPREGSR